MNISTIIASGALIVGIVNGYFIWQLYNKTARVLNDVGSQFSEINIDNKLSNMFSEASAAKGIDGLTKMVFDNIRSKYNLKANSFSEITDEIKLHPNMALELKELLIEFFNEVIRISYRAETISDYEKEDLKEKIKLILRITHS